MILKSQEFMGRSMEQPTYSRGKNPNSRNNSHMFSKGHPYYGGEGAKKTQFKRGDKVRLGIKHTPEIIEKMKNNHTHSLIGRERPSEVCIKVSKSLMGHIVTPKTRLKISKSKTGQFQSLEASIKKSLSLKKAHSEGRHSGAFKKGNIPPPSAYAHIKKSSLEMRFEAIVNKNNLPYKYVGNGACFIERKNPDFINTNGKKIAIEIYSKQHKLHFGPARGKGIKVWQKERREIFSKHGWAIIFFDEKELIEETIIKKLSSEA